MSPRIKREELKRELYTIKQVESLRHKFKTDKGYNYCINGKQEIEREIERLSIYLK